MSEPTRDAMPPDDFIDIVFDGPPEHLAGRFVEVENPAGASVRVGQWVQREDGYWCLRIPNSERRGMERAARLVCRDCRDLGLPRYQYGRWLHEVLGGALACHAPRIWDALAAEEDDDDE